MRSDTPPPPADPAEAVMDEQGVENEEDYEIIDILDLEGSEGSEAMEEEDDDFVESVESVIVFNKHQDSVFCAEFDSTGDYAVSGGQDHKAYVWHTIDGSMRFECGGFEDSVIAVGFNHDSSLVAAGGMDGKIAVWHVESGNNTWSEVISEITWLRWHPSDSTLFAGTIDGSVWKWGFPDLDCQCFVATSPLQTACGEISEDGKICVVGHENGSVKIWDTATGVVVGSVTGKDAHTLNVVSIAISSDGNLIATGSEDGTIKLIRSSTAKVLHTYECTATSDMANDPNDEKECVENIAFLKAKNLLVTGTNAGVLRIFDISTHASRVVVNVGAPIVKLICLEQQNRIFVTENGNVELYCALTGDTVTHHIIHNEPILNLAISRDKKKLLSCADDKTCKIFDVDAF